ncbi:response regulator [Paraburkholderia sp. IW21]|uniref:response regulator n=1 Tax=Paraburkholderia sp. IW21 TaxID=3242488 RepID=UPI00352125EF
MSLQRFESCCAASRHACRVFLVDDDADTVESLALLLGLDGHIVRTAISAPEALITLESFTPDVAFLDVNMPEIDGFTLAAQLRNRPALGHVKFVALTGDASRADREAALAAGFDHHLAKPVDMRALSSILASAGRTLS